MTLFHELVEKRIDYPKGRVTWLIRYMKDDLKDVIQHFVQQVMIIISTNSDLNKGKSAVPPLFNGLEVLSSTSDKPKLFAKNFSKNSNLDHSGTSLHVFPSRTNLKLHNISVTLKMVKKVIMNCEHELSYILGELLNKCLKESCFPDCWKVSLVVPVLKNVGELPPW